eukprot:COSAG01_NODE_5593_length_4159_cov_2.227340_3_plen_75_part_00
MFLPRGVATRVGLPCERGDEHWTHQAKADPVCHMGRVNVLNASRYRVSVWARASRPGAAAVAFFVAAVVTEIHL